MGVLILSIYVDWDGRGQLRYRFTSPSEAVTKDDDVLVESLAIGALMSIPRQLGILTPVSSLALCPELIEILAGKRYVPRPIDPVLRSVRIDIWQGAQGNIYHTFHPDGDLFADENTVEEGIRQILINYAGDLISKLNTILVRQLKVFLLISILYYLDRLSEAYGQGRLNPTGANWQLQAEMTSWAASLYRAWESRDVSAVDIPAQINKVRQRYDTVCTNLEIAR